MGGWFDGEPRAQARRKKWDTQVDDADIGAVGRAMMPEPTTDPTTDSLPPGWTAFALEFAGERVSARVERLVGAAWTWRVASRGVTAEGMAASRAEALRDAMRMIDKVVPREPAQAQIPQEMPS